MLTTKQVPLLHAMSLKYDNGTGTYYQKRIGIRALDRFIQSAENLYTVGLTKTEIALMIQDANEILAHIDIGGQRHYRFVPHMFQVSKVLAKTSQTNPAYAVLCELALLERELRNATRRPPA